MPNDAKLGLLVGVLGVVAAAVVSASRPTPQPAASVPTAAKAAKPADPGEPPSRPAVVAIDLPPAAPPPRPVVKPTPADLPTELPSTPVVRTRHEPDATPTSQRREGP
jgi:hypothetical protein